MDIPALTATADVDSLAAACDGVVLGPRDEGYHEACAAWNLAWTHRPAVVVRAATEADVVRAVRHAASNSLAIVVQSTGHGVTVPADEGSVLIVTTDLDSVRVDPATRTATLGGGTSWTPVLAAAQEHGLAPLLGSAPHVGAVGYTLGGGIGWLARKHGLAVDRVRQLRVVLADGSVVAASTSERPDLFWALCGAGPGTLGVVVEMTVELVPVADVYAGNLFYPLEMAGEVFDFYRSWADRAPGELTSAFNITSFPPLEQVPEPLRGRTFTIVRGCHAGAVDDPAGPALVDEWRAWREPSMDLWGRMPFAACAQISQDPVDPVPAAASGRWLAGLDTSVVESMVDAVVGDGGPSPMLLAEARHAGGAVSRPNPAASFAARDAAWSLELIGMIPDAGADVELERRFEKTWRRLEGLLTEQHGYLNFVDGQERVQTATHAFDASTRSRLAAVKREYDRDDLFRHGIPLEEEK